MGTYVTPALFILMTVLLTRSGVQSQAPSLAEFAAFCNEVGSSGGAPNPFVEVLCRQLAEQQPPPTAAATWSDTEAFNVSEEAPTFAYELGIPPSAQQEEWVTAKQANHSGILVNTTNHISDYQPRENETLNVNNTHPGAVNTTGRFSVGGGQTVIILNNTFPPEQIDLEVASDFGSNIEVLTTGDPYNISAAVPQNKFLHAEPYNVSTFYVGERVQGQLAGDDGHSETLNSTRTFQAPVLNLRTLKRGDQMPVSDNTSSTANQVYNNTDTVGRLPEAGPQQPVHEDGELIQQSDIQDSNGTLSTNNLTDVHQVLDKEETNVLADGMNTTLESQTEEQMYVEQQLAITTSETEILITTEVAEDSSNNSSAGSSMIGIETQDGITANGSFNQSRVQVTNVNNATQVSPVVGREPEIIKLPPSSGFFEIQSRNMENDGTPIFDTTKSTTGKYSEQVITETYLVAESASLPDYGNEQSFGSEQEVTGRQFILDQATENVPHATEVVETQSALGEPSEDWLETNAAMDQSEIFSTERIVDDTQNQEQANNQGPNANPATVPGENLGHDNPTEVWSTSGDISTVLPTSSLASELGHLNNQQNEVGDTQYILVTEPSGNSENKAETTSSQPFVMDFSTETLPAGSNAQQENSESSSSKGVSNSNWNTGSSTQFGLAGSSSSRSPTSVGSNSQVTVGVSSTEKNSVASTLLPPSSKGDVVGDSILVLKELSTKLLDGLAGVHCRQSLDEFWKNVTEVFQRISAARKPTVRDMTASVTEVIESYRRESPYWKTIATELEEATSERRWRQLLASVAEHHRGDRATQLRLLTASRELRRAVRASLGNPECRTAGAQPAPDSCDQFLLCYRAGWQWRALTLHCPRGSAFSRSERHCVWWPLADCRPEAPAGHRDDGDDSSSDSDSDDSDSDSSESGEKRWSLFRHGHSLFRMFDFRH